MALVSNEFASAERLTAQFAITIADLLGQAIAQKGQATLVVSGGRTPVALFQTLAQTNLKRKGFIWLDRSPT